MDNLMPHANGRRGVSEADRSHMFWWSPPGRRFPLRRRRENVGDYLSPILVKRLLQRRGLRLGDMRATDGRRLFAIGSILHFARDGDVVWGSGVNGKIDAAEHRFRDLDVRAVRGPQTRAFLLERGVSCPDCYGDPALLTPRFFPDFGRHKRFRRGIVLVPHMHDLPRVSRLLGVAHCQVVSPHEHWQRFIASVVSAELVLSSSLHGLILAEAFGVPARLLRITDREPLFKYRDYYQGTGRQDFYPVDSIEGGLALGGEPPPEFDADALEAAFPFDLWDARGA